MKSAMILPCGVNSAQNRAVPGLELENVGGDKPMQKVPRAVTGDFDHATVGEQGSLHGKKLSKYRQERRTLAGFSQGSDAQ